MPVLRRPPSAPPGHAHRGRDAGISLIEVVIAIAVVGTAVVPLMLAGVSSVKVSSQTHTVAQVETVLVNAADRVNRASESCDYDVYVEAAALETGWAPDRASATYQYYVPGDNSPIEAGTWANGACPGAQRPEALVQKVTIKVTSPDGKVTRTLVVVKSDV